MCSMLVKKRDISESLLSCKILASLSPEFRFQWDFNHTESCQTDTEKASCGNSIFRTCRFFFICPKHKIST